jgi:hypothetical protein
MNPLRGNLPPIREGWKKEQIAKTFVKTLLRLCD